MNPPGFTKVATTLLALLVVGPLSHAQTSRPSGSLVCWGQQYIPYVDPGTRFTGVSAGVHYTVALTRDGAVVAWGLNHQFRQAEAPVAASGDVVVVAAGQTHTVALKRDGTVVAWGNNFSGQVTGTPTTTGLGYATAAPVRLGGEVLGGITAVAAGGNHTVALKANGTLVAWGLNFNGQVTGTPTTTGQANATADPVRLGGEVLSGLTAVAAGETHTVALKNDGSVLAWGDNTYSQTDVPTEAQSGVVAIAAAPYTTFALKSDGSVVGWGDNSSGQTDVPLAARSGVTAIAAGGFRVIDPFVDQTVVTGHTIALKSDGSVVAWGDNSYGQTDVPVLARSGVLAIAAGSKHSVALKSDGSIVAWGSNLYAESEVPGRTLRGVVAVADGLALKSDGSLLALGGAPVPAEAQSGVIAIAAGDQHSAALTKDGSVVAWGNNASGQTDVPAEAQSGVVAVAAADFVQGELRGHTAALKNDGSVVVWGDNSLGQTEVPLRAQAEVVAIAATALNLMALRSDGLVVGWGYGGSGATTVPSDAQSGVVAIAAGMFHSVALKGDGRVVAWGGNDFGQTSVPLAAKTGVMAIGAGYHHTIAVKTNGAVVAWGYNMQGQTTVPAGLPPAFAVAGTYGHTYALVQELPPTLTLLRNADQTLSLTWTGAGTLEQTESLTVPNWQPASSQANPQTILPAEPRRLFRVRAE